MGHRRRPNVSIQNPTWKAACLATQELRTKHQRWDGSVGNAAARGKRRFCAPILSRLRNMLRFDLIKTQLRFGGVEIVL